MNQVSAILDESGLTSLEAVEEFLKNRSDKDVTSLISGLVQAIAANSHSLVSEASNPTIDQANFLPSSSMRGHRGCVNWGCRGSKIDALARYVALYCDKAIIATDLRVWLESQYQPDQAFKRVGLSSSLAELVLLRPLIEEGLIVLVPEELHFCKQHWQEAVPQRAQIMKVAQDLALQHSGEFEVKYKPGFLAGKYFASLTVRGPEDYIEHGSLIRFYTSPPSWLAERNKGRIFTLSKQFVRKHKLILPFFMSNANDAILQTYFGLAFNARYVTDLPGEAEFFSTLNAKDELSRNTATLCARLTHTIPMLRDIPIETVIRVRNNEPEAFQSYRSTMTAIVRDHVRKGTTVSEKDARDIYIDLLKPRLDALELQAKNLRRSQIKRSALKITASSALVGLGIYGGLLPAHMLDLVKTIGGFSVAKDLAESITAIEQNPTEVRNHNLYFLLRMKQELS